MQRKKPTTKTKLTDTYQHLTVKTPVPPDVGTQTRFKKRKPTRTYRYDSSLAPELAWDGRNPAREQGEQLIQRILQTQDLDEAKAAAKQLQQLGQPFLNWAGKAERFSFDVPTLPLFVHERLSTQAILETLRSHEKQLGLNLFGDSQQSVIDQVLRPYQHGPWANRLILGDSLVVMNSLLEYENQGGQVQMIYIDPPYGVKFGSNFQPFVRKRDVKPGDDADMTREPEMVQAYRDTWELGLHSYLTYLRDRLLLARDLLHPTGSIFVQISDENVHHVREVMDEVFGAENFVSEIVLGKTSSATAIRLATVNDFLLWYAKDISVVKFRRLFTSKPSPFSDTNSKYDQVELPDGTRRPLTSGEKSEEISLPVGSKVYRLSGVDSQTGTANTRFPVVFKGETFFPSGTRGWSTSFEGMERLIKAGRIQKTKSILNFVRFFDDYPLQQITNVWMDIGGAVQSRSDPKIYVVQTGTAPIERCILMTTDPGDLVLDPTCGSGTTPYVAEQWGRRWIAIDTSRVPLALARQRLLTATFPYYQLQDEKQGPKGGFVYKRKQNNKGEEIGGIVPHITLKSIANNEPPAEEVLVDRPELLKDLVRVTGPFWVQATLPRPMDWEAQETNQPPDDYNTFADRMVEVLRRSPVLRVAGNQTVTFKNIRPPAKTLSLSAEALVENGQPKPVAFVFGPENGAVSENLVYNAAKEANSKNYSHLYVVGFAIQPNARLLIEQGEAAMGISATYVQASLDLQMGDLLKTMRSSQIFSVAGLPEVAVKEVGKNRYQVELIGLDVFNPVTMELDQRKGEDVPAWFLDTNYNGLCFYVGQAFFPRTSAWDNLKKALKGNFEDSVWEHLSGTVSEPFTAGDNRQIAVKVIDDRGNELMIVKDL